MQTVTLTINVPDERAARLRTLPADTINRYAVAALTDAIDDADNSTLQSPLPSLPPSLAQPLADALREGFADADAGRVINGDVFLVRLRQRRAERE